MMKVALLPENNARTRYCDLFETQRIIKVAMELRETVTGIDFMPGLSMLPYGHKVVGFGGELFDLVDEAPDWVSADIQKTFPTTTFAGKAISA